MAKLKPPPYPKPPRYLLIMLGSAVAFFIGATVYTYVWPDKSAVAEAPGDRLPPTLPIAPYVYNVNGDKVGQIADVLFGNDQKINIYILNVGDWFLDGSEKNIAVPSQKMSWVKGQDSEWTAVVRPTCRTHPSKSSILLQRSGGPRSNCRAERRAARRRALRRASTGERKASAGSQAPAR